jgi:hypothetical protein
VVSSRCMPSPHSWRAEDGVCMLHYRLTPLPYAIACEWSAHGCVLVVM